MLESMLDYRLDVATFDVALVVATLAIHVWLRRRHGGRGVAPLAWAMLIATVAVGSAATEWAGLRERDRMRDMLGGVAPTYAQEMELLGHARLPLDARPDDPRYLAMIEAQVRWQRANPNVNDIYTFRRRPDGQIVLFVDSETDYDRDGRHEGEREQRTAIGEPYADASEPLLRAFDGVASFDGEPYTDRWGTWVSANVPLRDEAGRVEAVLGVDYDASRWTAAIARARGSTLALATLMATAVLASTAVVGVTRAELAKRAVAERALRQSEGRLRAILDTEPEWVQVLDAQGRVTEINPAGIATLAAGVPGAVLGRTIAPLIAPEHRAAYEQGLADCLRGASVPLRFAIDVRAAMGRAGGRRWLDGHAVPLRDGAGPVAAVLCVLRDVTLQRQAQEERERLQRELVDASRQAGMAEVATGVLHNVGNVLNSVRVSAGVLSEAVQRSKVAGFRKAAGLIRENRADLAAFLTTSPKGRVLPDYLIELSDVLAGEQASLQKELSSLASSVEHIKEIVGAQQTFARDVRADETFDLAAAVDDAVRMNAISLERHSVEIVRQFNACPPVTVDRHKVLQILINLIANAKRAVDGPDRERRAITLTVGRSYDAVGRAVARVSVSDTGVGIAPENLTKLFRHGFTTRADGHGFGLHSAACAAQQMKGSLSAHSEGPGKGATFVLEIPFQPTEAQIPCPKS